MTRRNPLEARYLALLTANGPAIARTAAIYEREPREREDLIQDIWLALWQALPTFRAESSERTFLFRIAHNRGISHATRRRLPVVDPGKALDIADDDADPKSQIDRSQQMEQLVTALHGLPLIDRQIVNLSLEGLKQTEIAEVLGLSANNVAVRLNRARGRLRTLMEKHP